MSSIKQSSITSSSFSPSIKKNSFAAILRNFLTLGGTNETATAADYTAVSGDTIKFQYSTTKTGDQTLFDETTGLNRLFLTLGTLGTVFTAPAGVTVDVDGNGNVFVPDGRLNNVTLAIGAAAVGLVINHYFSKFGAAAEFSQGVPANILFTGSDNRLYKMGSGNFGGGAIEPNALNPGANDMTLSSVIAGDWERFTLVGADWLGAELVVNGGFDTGLSGWVITNTDATHKVTHVGTSARFEAGTFSPILSFKQTAVAIAGRRYRTNIDLTVTSGQIKLITVFTDTPLSDGLNSIVDIATGSDVDFIRNSENVDILINSVSVKRILEAA